MIHSPNKLVDSLTNWTEWLTEIIEWFTEPAWKMDLKAGVNDSFTKWNDQFTHKSKRIHSWNGLTNTFTNHFEQFTNPTELVRLGLELTESLNFISEFILCKWFWGFYRANIHSISISARMLLSYRVPMETTTMETVTCPIDCNPTIPCPLGMYFKSFDLEGFLIQVTSKVD